MQHLTVQGFDAVPERGEPGLHPDGKVFCPPTALPLKTLGQCGEPGEIHPIQHRFNRLHKPSPFPRMYAKPGGESREMGVGLHRWVALSLKGWKGLDTMWA
jgi:hypothetical protein